MRWLSRRMDSSSFAVSPYISTETRDAAGMESISDRNIQRTTSRFPYVGGKVVENHHIYIEIK
jgi:hypothetical protein